MYYKYINMILMSANINNDVDVHKEIYFLLRFGPSFSSSFSYFWIFFSLIRRRLFFPFTRSVNLNLLSTAEL